MNESIAAFAVFGFIALLILFMGVRRGFFIFEEKPWIFPLKLIHVLSAFGIYFLTTAILTRLAITLLRKTFITNYMAFTSWLNFGISCIVLLFLWLYLYKLPSGVYSKILKRKPEEHSRIEDITTAFYAWIMAFPLVLALSQGIELILSKVFHVTHVPDQIAVKFLKSTFTDPIHFILAIFSIIVLAPLIEETLFRGFLQSFIRQHLGAKQAVLITSVCFALFHYSANQALGNFSIIPPLFLLALFLGFVYEKQGSLLTPIVLHASFNTVSVINLYLFGGLSLGI